jgi:hypothetical protein
MLNFTLSSPASSGKNFVCCFTCIFNDLRYQGKYLAFDAKGKILQRTPSEVFGNTKNGSSLELEISKIPEQTSCVVVVLGFAKSNFQALIATTADNNTGVTCNIRNGEQNFDLNILIRLR